MIFQLERYLKLGWYLIPIKRGEKKPLIAWKEGASNDRATIEQWLTQWPECSWAIYCKMSELIVLDIDPRNGGDETFKQLVNELGPLPKCPMQKTGGDGWHYPFKHPKVDVKGKLGKGIDVKSDGYILVEPSKHPSGEVYEWTLPPWEVDLPHLPPKWLAMVGKPEYKRTEHAQQQRVYSTETTPYGRKALEDECSKLASMAPETGRNDTLNNATLRLKRLSLGGEIVWSDALNALRNAAHACGLHEDPGCGERGIEATVNSACRAAASMGGISAPPKVDSCKTQKVIDWCDDPRYQPDERGHMDDDLFIEDIPINNEAYANQAGCPPDAEDHSASDSGTPPPNNNKTSDQTSNTTENKSTEDNHDKDENKKINHQFRFLIQDYKIPTEWITEDAPQIPVLLRREGEPYLPKGIIAMTAGPGGHGKTQMNTQLAVSIATGRPLFPAQNINDDIIPVKPGYVGIFLGEENERDFHDRLRRTCFYMGRDHKGNELRYGNGLIRPGEIEMITEHIIPVYLNSIDASFLTRGEKHGDLKPTDIFDIIFKSLTHHKRVKNWDCLIFDPASRIMGLDAETLNAAATRFIQHMEKLTLIDGHPTVLIAHHTSKTAMRSKESDQGALRGSSALGDGSRWVSNLMGKDLIPYKDGNKTKYLDFNSLRNNFRNQSKKSLEDKTYEHLRKSTWLKLTNSKGNGLPKFDDLQLVIDSTRQLRRVNSLDMEFAKEVFAITLSKGECGGDNFMEDVLNFKSEYETKVDAGNGNDEARERVAYGNCG